MDGLCFAWSCDEAKWLFLALAFVLGVVVGIAGLYVVLLWQACWNIAKRAAPARTLPGAHEGLMKKLLSRCLAVVSAAALAGVLYVAVAPVLLGDAIAQTTTASAPAPTSIDLSPLLQIAWTVAGMVATALAGWIATKVCGWLHLSSQDTIRGYVLDALQAGIGAAQTKFGGKPVTVDVQSQTVASVANYLITAVPDGLKALGFTLKPDDPKLTALIATRMASQPTVTQAAPLAQGSAG